jgi:hypothetical protein
MYLGLPWVDAAHSKLNFAVRRMLFRGSKAKDIGVFRQVAIEEAEAFNQSMQDPTVDVYACLVNFVGQSAPVRPKLAQLPS